MILILPYLLNYLMENGIIIYLLQQKMGCEQSIHAGEPSRFPNNFHDTFMNRNHDQQEGRFFDDILPLFNQIEKGPQDKKEFYDSFSHKMGELYQLTIHKLEKSAAASFLLSDDLRIKISKQILLNVLNFIHELQRSPNWKSHKFQVFHNISNAQKKIIEFLKFKYPRNKKNFLPTELIELFKGVNDSEHTDYDLLINSKVFFDFEAIRDYEKKEVISKIKQFLNKIINETNRFYEIYRLNMEEIFAGLEGSFKINRKLSENVSVFPDTSSEVFEITSPQIFRVLVKWIQSLEDIFLKTDHKLRSYKYFKIVEQEEDENFNNQYNFFPLYTGKNEIISILSSLLETSRKRYEQQQEEHEISLTNFNDTLIRVINKKTDIPEINQNEIKTIKYSHYIGKFVQFLAIEKLVNMITELTNVRKKIQKKCRKAVDLIRCEVFDLLRSQFMGSKSEIIKVFQRMKQMENKGQLKITRIKNRFSTPLNDCMINYMFTGGNKKSSFLVCEIQLILHDKASSNDASKVKEKIYEEFNHILYEIERSIFKPTTQISLALAYGDTMMGYQKKIELKKQYLESLRCPENQVLSCEYELQIPYICSLCSKFYSVNQNTFPIHRCQNCNFYACPRCLFEFDPQIRDECYKKQITNYIKDNVHDISDHDGNEMFFFDQNYFPILALQKKNRNIIDCLEEEMRDRQKQYAFILQFKNGKKKIHGYSLRSGHIYPSFYDFVPRSTRKGYKHEQFGEFDIVLFLDNKVKVEKDSKIDDAGIDSLKNIIQQVKIVRRVKEIYQYRWGDHNYILDVGEEVREGDNSPQQAGMATNFKSSNSFTNSMSSMTRNDYSQFQKALSHYKNLEGRLDLDYLDLTELNIKSLTHVSPKCLRFLRLKSNKLKSIDSVINNFENLEEIDVSRNQLTDIKITKRLSKIRIIDLTENFIEKVSGFTHGNLPKLKGLNLEGNMIEKFPKMDLESLIWLNFNDNKLDCLSVLKDSSLPKLRKLCLDKNNISSIPSVSLPNLQELAAEGNSLTEITFLQDYARIESVNLRGNKITGLPKLSLEYMESMKLSENRISEMQEFKDSFLPKLINLDLSKNCLTTMPKLAFEELIDLNLSENEICCLEQLSAGSSMLYNLKWLDLSHNSIQNFHALNMDNLQVLVCSHNQIRSIDFVIHSSLPILNEIDVSFNKVEQIPAFKEFPSLEFLNFSSNMIDSMEIFVKESKLPNLRILIMDRNKITGFYPASFPSLTEFRVSENMITQMHQVEQEHLQACTILDLSHNSIDTLPLMFLESIEELLLNNNQIVDIQNFKNSDFPKLSLLDLSKNKIEEFPELDLENVRKFNIQENQLKSMKGISKSIMSSVEEINLSGNLLEELETISMERLMDINLSANQIQDISLLEHWHTPEISFINLNKNKITQLCALKSSGLSTLNVSCNQLGSISKFCKKSNLPKLLTLNLNNNKIQGELPAMRFESLKTIEIIKNNFSSLQQFGEDSNLPKLDSLKASFNHIKSIREFSSTGFPKLKSIQLIKNEIEDIEDFSFSDLKKLKNLNLQQNKLLTLPKITFKNLVVFNCEANLIRDLRQFEKSELPNLEKLSFKANKIDEWPSDLYLQKLKKLNLAENQLETNENIQSRNFPELLELNLRKNKIKNVVEIKLPKLLSLFLQNNSINRNSAELWLQLKENKSKMNEKLQIIVQKPKIPKQKKSQMENQPLLSKQNVNVANT